MDEQHLIEWVSERCGPILRYRIARDLADDCAPATQERLLAGVLACDECRRWLDNLSASRSIHGGKDVNAENPLAKLLEYGLDRCVPEFNERVQAVLNRGLGLWDAHVLAPFLVRAGYTDHEVVQTWLRERLDKLVETAQAGDFDLYLSAEEAAHVPNAWRGRPIYKDKFGHEAGYAIPTCYDFGALAYWPEPDARLMKKLEAVVAYLSDPRFQSTVGGYGWDRANRRCYAAGRVFLACAEPARMPLFVEWGARFASARKSDWFQRSLKCLEGWRTPRGTYSLPANLVAERSGYYIYGGLHMGLGEDRRNPQAIELESTFRMLSIKRRMAGAVSRSSTHDSRI